MTGTEPTFSGEIQEVGSERAATVATTGAVLLTLASGQFLMTLDSSVMTSTGPLLLAGLGVGALASQLGSVTVSSVPDEESGEVGGLPNTWSNLGTSVGTALIGSILIASLSASFLRGIGRTWPCPRS